MKKSQFTRRNFSQLSAAALGGMMAGITIGCQSSSEGDPQEGEQEGDGPGNNESADRSDDAAEDVDDHNETAHTDIHVCRGLNACMSDTNGCTGTSQCATVTAHACAGQNECKGQGGCGETPGSNECKGQGHCAVPLQGEMWQKAREAYEEKMKAQEKVFGPAPGPTL